ncbi:unnamed protein product [Withania somnifera]
MAYVANRAQSSSSQPPLLQKLMDDPVNPKNAQSSVTCVYQSHIGGYWRNVTVIWIKNLMNHSVTLTVDSVESDYHQTCQIDLKPWHFWAKKGYKTFEVDGNQLEAYWDLRSAKFSGSPEPDSDFYVALVSDEEVKTKSRPALVDALLFYKKEHVFGKKSFSTRAKFDQRKQESDIVVESSTTGPRDPEISGETETVLVNKQPVQVFWDVHAWLFCSPGSGRGLFIFKPGASEDDSDREESSGGGSDCSDHSKYYSTLSYSKASTFCLFLYAWKIE